MHSPALLLRAGVGPADALKTLGIGVVADRPGVGANFQNHPIVNLALQMMPHAVQRPPYGTHHHSWIRYSSQLAEMGGSDIGICFVNKTSWHDVGNRVGALSLILLKPLARGRVSLQSADPDEQPLTESNLLGDERDRLRMLEAMARGWEILNSNEVRPLWRSAYPVSGATWRKYLSSPSLFNSLFSTGIATMMDMSAAFGRWIVSRVSTDGVELEDVMKDPEKINRFITGSIGGMAHPVGTCRIGRSDDAAAVVDPQGRVYGTQGLRVADASLMPTLPRGNTNLPTTMIAEKVAAAMLH